MKTLFAATAALTAVAGLAAGPALASDGPEVHVRHAVARMVVIVEDRADIGVEIEPGRANLPAPKVTRRGSDLYIDGDLGDHGIRNCRGGADTARQPGEGASVEVRRVGRVDLSDAPLIVVRTPRNVDVDVEGAVFGAVGRGAASVEFGNAGCGSWTVANTGALDLSLAGSGDIRAGTSSRLSVSLAGSGDISAVSTGPLEASLAGSGDISVGRVDGDVEASIAGSGNVRVGGGRIGKVEASIAGSGDVDIRGTATSVEADIMGSGDVTVSGVTGGVEHSVMGSGTVTVGGQAYTRR